MCSAQILLYKTDWTMAVISKFCVNITRHFWPYQINKHFTQSLFFKGEIIQEGIFDLVPSSKKNPPKMNEITYLNFFKDVDKLILFICLRMVSNGISYEIEPPLTQKPKTKKYAHCHIIFYLLKSVFRQTFNISALVRPLEKKYISRRKDDDNVLLKIH